MKPYFESGAGLLASGLGWQGWAVGWDWGCGAGWVGAGWRLGLAVGADATRGGWAGGAGLWGGIVHACLIPNCITREEFRCFPHALKRTSPTCGSDVNPSSCSRMLDSAFCPNPNPLLQLQLVSGRMLLIHTGRGPEDQLPGPEHVPEVERAWNYILNLGLAAGLGWAGLGLG